MNENKQLILSALADTLRLTRACEDLMHLEYDPERELVNVYFIDDTEAPSRKINVACDSGIAMIRDVLKGIDV